MGNDPQKMEAIRAKQDEMKKLAHVQAGKCKDSSGNYVATEIIKLLKLFVNCKYETVHSEKEKKKAKTIKFEEKVAQGAIDEWVEKFDDGSFDISFSVFDINKDGKLTFKELFAVTKAISLITFRKLNKKGLQLLFETLDYDGNGYLDKEEYKLFVLCCHVHAACEAKSPN